MIGILLEHDSATEDRLIGGDNEENTMDGYVSCPFKMPIHHLERPLR